MISAGFLTNRTNLLYLNFPADTEVEDPANSLARAQALGFKVITKQRRIHRGTDTLGNLFFLLSAQESGVAVAAVFTSIAPVTTVLFAALILRERIGRRQAVGIGLAGVATVAIALGGLS